MGQQHFYECTQRRAARSQSITLVRSCWLSAHVSPLMSRSRHLLTVQAPHTCPGASVPIVLLLIAARVGAHMQIRACDFCSSAKQVQACAALVDVQRWRRHDAANGPRVTRRPLYGLNVGFAHCCARWQDESGHICGRAPVRNVCQLQTQAHASLSRCLL